MKSESGCEFSREPMTNLFLRLQDKHVACRIRLFSWYLVCQIVPSWTIFHWEDSSSVESVDWTLTPVTSEASTSR